MSRDLDAFADGLVMEALSDTAQNFFGARKGLENEMELFRTRQRELVDMERRVRRRAGLLHLLLLDADAALGFYRELGLDAAQFVDAVDPEYRSPVFKVPWALTARGRYVKAVAKAYAMARDVLDGYLHGRHVRDPDGSGRKILTTNYELLSRWCERINQRIENVNRNMSPSGTMCFVRGLDPGRMSRERVAGATIEGRCEGLDAELAFKPLPCMVVDQTVFPELPEPGRVRADLRRAARKVYGARPDAARRVLREVARG